VTDLVTLEDAHGLSDINSIKWCTLSPSKAAATLRSLEGGEEDAEGGDENASVDLDSRWKGCEDWFATAGDDGLIKVWKLEEGESVVEMEE
jgi:WD40 repeat protein